MPPSLSALIIAKDEERDLPGCLDSLKGLAAETVVLVDDSTTDRTAEIALAAGCKVSRRRFDDYARQRQAALDACTREWVLWIDADERLSEELKERIPHLMAKPDVDGWAFYFQVRFLGANLRFGGLGREKHVRLFRRNKSLFTGGRLHEGIQIDGNVGLCAGPGKMLHEPYRDVADYMGKLERYTDLAAQKRFEMGRRFRPWHYLIAPWEFTMRAFLKLGFLDGKPGLTWAWLSAYHSWLKYAKLKKLEHSQ